MAEPDRPRSPFAAMADLSARTPVRVLSPGEIERLLAEHRLYLETEYHGIVRITGWLRSKVAVGLTRWQKSHTAATAFRRL